MTDTNRYLITALPLLAAAFLAASPVHADKSGWKGKGKHGGKERIETEVEIRTRYFGNREREVVRRYYVEEHGRGHCPPGLAKKHNGCMPPGLAKTWRVGQPLPHDVVYHDLPVRLSLEIGLPPSGYRYVRVGQDILMIAVGTGLIVDALSDLNAL
jgi:Ni/Co efflux regulator RcnB